MLRETRKIRTVTRRINKDVSDDDVDECADDTDDIPF